MRNSKLLSKIFTILFIFLFYSKTTLSNEPVDIWKIEKKENLNEEILLDNNEDIIQGVKIQQQNEKIIVNDSLDTNNIKLAGLYDPSENGLSIDMWSNSDGNEIKFFLKKLISKNLSSFSNKLLDIALLTNSYVPSENISDEEFIEFKFQYLINKKDFNLIKNFLIKNSSIKNNDKLIRFYSDFYLTNSQIDKSCEIFDFVKVYSDDYLSNFKIYCLIFQNKKEEAQLLFDLKSELGSIDEFFIKKFNVLMGYEDKNDSISEKNILYFHLSHKTNINFIYEPNITTPKFIWTYLSTSNLLKDSNLIDVESSEQVELIEIATNEEVYKEKELLNLYKRFKFDINQLINVNDSYKLLPTYEGRALLYQRLLLTSDSIQKLNLSSKLKNSFDEDNLSKAFDEELSKILKTIDENEIPSNYTIFYEKNSKFNVKNKAKIKINNKIIHQSKLLNYFLNKTSLPRVEKETNDLLKKIKKNKKYSFSKKDIIIIESLKSDGVQILKKYNRLYEYKLSIPSDINSMIVNGETGLVLLKIADIIGEDEIENLDLDSVSFIVGIMNELKIINLRNEILLEVLPLKV
tara:strand:- start:2937 stop:4664 length:1728 start_codon:yes stop_codon:yes gene_type:complete